MSSKAYKNERRQGCENYVEEKASNFYFKMENIVTDLFPSILMNRKQLKNYCKPQII